MGREHEEEQEEGCCWSHDGRGSHFQEAGAGIAGPCGAVEGDRPGDPVSRITQLVNLGGCLVASLLNTQEGLREVPLRLTMDPF